MRGVAPFFAFAAWLSLTWKYFWYGGAPCGRSSFFWWRAATYGATHGKWRGGPLRAATLWRIAWCHTWWSATPRGFVALYMVVLMEACHVIFLFVLNCVPHCHAILEVQVYWTCFSLFGLPVGLSRHLNYQKRLCFGNCLKRSVSWTFETLLRSRPSCPSRLLACNPTITSRK